MKRPQENQQRKHGVKKLLCVVLLCAFAHGLHAYNLDSLYHVLDDAIAQADVYRRQKEDRLATMTNVFREKRTPDERYSAAMSLYREYVAYCNDSALHYLDVCQTCAQEMKRPDLQAEVSVRRGYQLADTGFYPEAMHYFESVQKEQLSGDLFLTYLNGMNHLYGEMGYYSHDEALSRQYHQKAQTLRDSILAMSDTTSLQYVALRSMVLNNELKCRQALPYSDKWKALCQPGTRDYAIMAFFRSEIFKNLGQEEEQLYWLVQSALIDVRNAINDQAALWSLANSLSKGGDLDRAYRYIDYSWDCISHFTTHMRSWMVSPIMTLINEQYKEKLHTAHSRLQWTLGLVSLLSLLLLGMLVYVQGKRKQLAAARNDLKATNDGLEAVNEKLKDTNAQLSQSNTQLNEHNAQMNEKNAQLNELNTQLNALIGQLNEANGQLNRQNELLGQKNTQLGDLNMRLNDSNRVKDEYITKFLQLCSDYIDKLDNYRIKVNRKLKANQYQDLVRMTGSEEMKETELKELFDNFDEVFLRLFPNFVAEFNLLLRPESQIVQPENNRLTTDLRIFALIRLGIEESSRIADFLRYSPNSIYNYRARTKNKALCERDEFEKRVKEIGIRETISD